MARVIKDLEDVVPFSAYKRWGACDSITWKFGDALLKYFVD